MRSDKSRRALADVQRHIELAQSFVAGMTLDDFKRDRRTVYAVIRCLEIVSEASRRVANDIKDRHPDIPWPDIAGAGNIYRHDYEDVDDELIWRTVHEGLTRLLEVAVAELARP